MTKLASGNGYHMYGDPFMNNATGALTAWL